METISKIIDLLDGKLTDSAEQDLFSELASDSVLRSDFRSYTSITGIISNNIDGFVPSGKVKSRIYAKAGFSIPATAPVLVDPVPAKSTFWGSKWFSSFLTGVTTLIITIILMKFLAGNGDVEISIAGSTQHRNLASTEESFPIIESSKANDSTPIQETKTIIKYVYIEKDAAEFDKAASNVDRLHASSRVALAKPSMDEVHGLGSLSPNQGINTFRYFRSGRYGSEEMLFNGLDNETKLGLSLELNNSLNWNFPKETVSPSYINKLNNLDIGLFYELSEHFQIGAKLNQETFYTEYTGTEPDGVTYMYRQQPNFTTISAGLRYLPLKSETLNPYIQLFGGANKGGYVLSPTIGLIFSPYDNLSFQIGAEYRYFFFYHRNQWPNNKLSWFNTSKAALTYGMLYSF